MVFAILITIVLLTAIFLFILLSHVRIHIKYRYKNVFLCWEMTVRFLGIEIKSYGGSSESGDGEKYIAKLINQFRNPSDFRQLHAKMEQKKFQYHSLLNTLMPSVTIKKLIWQTEFGTNDACSTGIVAGILWSIKGSVSAFVQEKCKMAVKPHINVIPHFQMLGLESELDCIALIKMGKAIRIRKKYKQIMLQQQSS